MTIIREFTKLQSASIYCVISVFIASCRSLLRHFCLYCVMSVFLIAKTRILLEELLLNLMFEHFSEICEEKSNYFEILHVCRVFYKRPK
jgi:hypothetical protein